MCGRRGGDEGKGGGREKGGEVEKGRSNELQRCTYTIHIVSTVLCDVMWCVEVLWGVVRCDVVW